MKDGYRYFISRPTAEDGNPELGSDPSYFRLKEGERYGTVFNMPVDFWNGSEWQASLLHPFFRYLDDVLGSGATVREILDEKDVPRA